MNKQRNSAILAVLALGPWLPLALALIVGPLVGLLNEGVAWLIVLVGILWAIIWTIRNAKRWVKMLQLAATGTPANMLDTAATILETWPTLVTANGWISRTALGHEPGLNMKIWGLITGNRSALGPQIARVEEAPAGAAVFVTLTPVCGADRLAAAAPSIADIWGAQSVEVTRPQPAVARLLVRTRDPLAGNSPQYAPQSQNPFAPPPPPPTADDFLRGMGQ